MPASQQVHHSRRLSCAAKHFFAIRTLHLSITLFLGRHHQESTPQHQLPQQSRAGVTQGSIAQAGRHERGPGCRSTVQCQSTREPTSYVSTCAHRVPHVCCGNGAGQTLTARTDTAKSSSPLAGSMQGAPKRALGQESPPVDCACKSACGRAFAERSLPN